jgi:hypothetical protein
MSRSSSWWCESGRWRRGIWQESGPVQEGKGQVLIKRPLAIISINYSSVKRGARGRFLRVYRKFKNALRAEYPRKNNALPKMAFDFENLWLENEDHASAPDRSLRKRIADAWQNRRGQIPLPRSELRAAKYLGGNQSVGEVSPGALKHNPARLAERCRISSAARCS